MRLTALAVKNYRGIPDFEVEISSHVVIVGPNEAGKTSILRAIHLAVGVVPTQLPASITRRDFTDPLKPIEIQVTFGRLSSEEEIAFTDQVVARADGLRLRIRVVATIDTADEQVDIQRSYPDFGDHRVSGADLSVIAWRFTPASRVHSQDLSGQRFGALGRLLSDVTIDDRSRFDAAAAAFQDAVTNLTELGRLRTTLAAALDDALPRAVAETDIDFISTATLADNPLRDVALALRDGSAWVALDEQSDGVQALATHALHAVVHAKANVVGIDEPELHLHPPAQRSIGRVLAQAETQHVIATNSPQVLSQFQPTAVLALAPNQAVRTLAAGSAASTDRFTARWWAEPVIEPLTAARLVVVEGVLDRLVVRAVAQALGIDLDRLSIAVFDLNGADTISTIRKLYGPSGFDVPMYGLVDADHESDWATEFGVSVASLASVGVYVCTPNLEGQIVSSLSAPRVKDLLIASGLFQATAISTSCGEPPDPTKLTEFLGQRRVKTDAAVAISTGITSADAAAIEPVRNLVNAAST